MFFLFVNNNKKWTCPTFKINGSIHDFSTFYLPENNKTRWNEKTAQHVHTRKSETIN